MNKILRFGFISLLLFSIYFIGPIFAKQNQSKNPQDLENQIKVLEQRIQELEAEKQQNQQQKIRHKEWDPFEEIAKMQDQMNNMFQNSIKMSGNFDSGLFSNNMSYDDNFHIKDENDKYILEFDMKGLNQQKTNIEITNHAITIKGEYSIENKTQESGKYVSSKSFSSFMKTIPLPKDADTANIKSDKKDDKLIIILPKKK
jgi:HSP20 family protein